mmetsp:Transcript_8661/g.13438  ORF Transcript_8661/g.13438 Transcript_8661/m.13438 type:complete len:110 (+) Transcript_8661:2988-3317(+)
MAHHVAPPSLNDVLSKTKDRKNLPGQTQPVSLIYDSHMIGSQLVCSPSNLKNGLKPLPPVAQPQRHGMSQTRAKFNPAAEYLQKEDLFQGNTPRSIGASPNQFLVPGKQ